MSQLFNNKTLHFENKSVTEQIPLPIKDAKFGILNLQAVSTPFSQEEHEFIFMIDCSGSMSDRCSDGRNKMQHIIHTLKNMILYFKENPVIKNHITIHSFDDKIYNILERSKINDSNFNEIITKIEQIMPRGSTNIELALENVNEMITMIRVAYPQHNICNIFMTDGDANIGNRDYTSLSQMVDRTVTNAFIGFGVDHDATLLNSISNGENSTYYFIDKLENSGFVYGEILHSVIYKLLKNVRITIENGLVYDFKNNSWSDSLSIGEITSESNKIYHICSNNSDKCVVTIIANTLGSSSEINITIPSEESMEDLTKYIYRQRTLQYLFIVQNFLSRKKANAIITDANYDMFTNFHDVNNQIKKEQIEIQEKLVVFIEEMKNFMKENNLTDDKIMKNLCDDIFICYRTFGTKFGDMYVAARQTSQGTQRGYAVNHTPEEEEDDICAIRHPRSIRKKNVFDFEELNISPLMHNISKITDSPYLTPTSTQLMREISSNNEMTDSDNDEESQK